MLARIHLTAILVERPKCVLEQTIRIILLLECHEPLPVLAEGGGHPRGHLVSSEELRIGPLHMKALSFVPYHEKKAYRRKCAATYYRLHRLSKPLAEGKENSTSCGQRDTQGRGEYLLTSSALETQRGSSMPISHWCRAAIVNAASRRDLGTHVPSKSAMAPPASSKSHADI